jgi:hypothetical protein
MPIRAAVSSSYVNSVARCCGSYDLFWPAGLRETAVEITPMVMTDLALALYLLKADDVEEEALKAGAVTPAEVRRWRADPEQAAAAGTFFCSWNNVTVAGRKPQTRLTEQSRVRISRIFLTHS